MLSEIFTIYRKELRSYFVSPVPYFVIALFSMYMGYRFFFDDQTAFFVYDKAEMSRGFFWQLERVLTVLVAVIGMGQWSSEFNRGTIETLMTLPVRTTSLVLGKFLSAWTLILICFIGTAAIPITVSNLGDLDWGPVHGGYFGAFLFCGALLALGVWISSLTHHQILAFVITLLVGIAFLAMYETADDAGAFFGPVFEQLSLASHFQAMGRGVVAWRDVLYFLSFMTLFLYLNVQSVENRRYR